MITLIKILCAGLAGYAALLAINGLLLPPGWRTNWLEIGCSVLAVLIFTSLLLLL